MQDDNRQSGESCDKRTGEQTTNNQLTTRRDALRLLGGGAAISSLSGVARADSTADDRDDDGDDSENTETSPWALPGIVEASASGTGNTYARTPLATLSTPHEATAHVGVIDDESDLITLRLSVETDEDSHLDLSVNLTPDRAHRLADVLIDGRRDEIDAADPLLGGGGPTVSISHFGFDKVRVGSEPVGDRETSVYIEVGDDVTRADASVFLSTEAEEIAAGLRRAAARREGDA